MAYLLQNKKHEYLDGKLLQIKNIFQKKNNNQRTVIFSSFILLFLLVLGYFIIPIYKETL